jgi:uncharacterized phage protein (TIGR01671 family)
MREIKFRGKRRRGADEWVYGDFSRGCKTYYDYIIEFVDSELCKNYISVTPETVSQYVGLKDMHNNELYEGDIVECKAGECRNGVWEYQRRYIVEYTWSDEMFEMLQAIENVGVEVIGNIYDNPELLKGEL